MPQQNNNQSSHIDYSQQNQPYAYNNNNNPRYPPQQPYQQQQQQQPIAYNNNINLVNMSSQNNYNNNNSSNYINTLNNNNNNNNININNNNMGSKTSLDDLHHNFNNSNNHNTIAEDSLRYQLQQDGQRRTHDPNQNRVPRITQGSNSNSDNAEDKKHPSYFYPPQPLSNLNDDPNHSKQDPSSSFATRLRGLYRFPCSNYGKSMMLVIGIEALLVIIMQIIIVVLYFKSLTDVDLEPIIGNSSNAGKSFPPYLDPRNPSRAIAAYLIVFVFAQLFQLVLTWDAVRAQNTIQLIGIVIFNFCCFAYSIFEISQTKQALMESTDFLIQNDDEVYRKLLPFLIVVVCVNGITQFLVTWIGYQLFQEFGWKIYKKIGADPNMKRMYRTYQIYLSLIKVDFFFFVGFSIQFIYLALTKNSDDPEYWLTIFVLPATILILWVAIYAVRNESRRWMGVFFLTMLCGVTYFVFKVFRMWIGVKAENYKGVKNFLTLFASLCLIAILLTIANATICFRNFGKGLKTHLVNNTDNSSNAASTTTGRLEID
ncbi:hypothetical protein BGZ76_011276 [Entomortierella beljakovae]|nr:hypothetical protein BGZ76_011276 [Entomortierella beljakovae]